MFDPEPPPTSLTGIVYEVTASGRFPLANVTVFFESFFETVIATTTTDSLGRYSLCRLPAMYSWVTAWKPGYRVTPNYVTLSGRNHMDLEVRRE